MKHWQEAAPFGLIAAGIAGLWAGQGLGLALQAAAMFAMVGVFIGYLAKGATRDEDLGIQWGLWAYAVCLALCGGLALWDTERHAPNVAVRRPSPARTAPSQAISNGVRSPASTRAGDGQSGSVPQPSAAASASEASNEQTATPPPIATEVNAPFSPQKAGIFDHLFRIVPREDTEPQRAALANQLAQENERLPRAFNSSWTWNAVFLRGNLITYSVTLPYSKRQENTSLLRQSLREEFVDAECRSPYSYLRRGYQVKLIVRDNENFDMAALDFAPSDLEPCADAFLQRSNR